MFLKMDYVANGVNSKLACRLDSVLRVGRRINSSVAWSVCMAPVLLPAAVPVFHFFIVVLMFSCSGLCRQEACMRVFGKLRQSYVIDH